MQINKYIKDIMSQLRSKETWKRVGDLNRFKSPREGLRPVSKEDMLPLVISIFIAAFLLALALFIVLSILK